MIEESFGVAFNLVKGMIFDVVKIIGPTAISILGVFIAWKLGIKFFKKLLLPKLYYYKNRAGYLDDDIEVIDNKEIDENLKEDLSGNLRGYDDEYENDDNEIFTDDDQWRDEEW